VGSAGSVIHPIHPGRNTTHGDGAGRPAQGPPTEELRTTPNSRHWDEKWAREHCGYLGLNQRGGRKVAVWFDGNRAECLLVRALQLHREMTKASHLLL